GRFFFQFAITTTVAVLISLVISLTITPMLCAFFLRVREMKRPLPAGYRGLLGPVFTLVARSHWLVDRWIFEPILLRPTDWLMHRLAVGYGHLLRHALRH